MRRLVVLFVVLTGSVSLVAAQTRSSSAEEFQKLFRVFQYISRIYVDEVDMAPLTERAISAMLEELDPHSAYIDRETMRGVEEEFGGSFDGIGIGFDIVRDTLRVVNTIAGGPAEKVGMLPDDRILKIDTLDAVGIRQGDVAKYLRGKRGTKVRLEVLRPGERDLLHFVMERDRIPLHTVDCAYMAAEDVGYIRLARFGRTTYEELVENYRRLNQPRKIILDLRGNGGGLLDQAIEVAGFFLPKNSEVVSTEGRAIPSTTFRTQSRGYNTDGGLVVLIDESSASASEIVTGAIQDWDRGVVIGRQSFGKGLVQRQIGLGDGSAIRLTMARYHTPSGRVIQRPYENGHRREYYIDHLRRYDDRVADSLNATAPEYFTLRYKRKVRGGGGIRPDIVVKSDTAGYSKYLGELVRRGVLREFVTEKVAGDRKNMLEKWPTAEKFAEGFLVGDSEVEHLAEFARERDIEPDTRISDDTRRWISIRIKALAAQYLYGAEGFYRVLNTDDEEAFRKAMEVLRDWEGRGMRILQGSSDLKKTY